MTVGTTNYPTPVQVNGYSCKNCTDVDLAKKHIDPAHPRSGPYGINANDDPTVKNTASVTFGGALGGLNAKLGAADTGTTSNSSSSRSVPSVRGSVASGTQLDLLT